MKEWGDQYEIHLMLDHSQNHNKHKPDELNAKSMSSSFRGAQPKMHLMVLEEGCLGPFPNTIILFYEAKWKNNANMEKNCVNNLISKYVDVNPLNELSLHISHMQTLVYSVDDVGPCYLSTEEHEKQKHHCKTGTFITKSKKVAKL